MAIDPSQIGIDLQQPVQQQPGINFGNLQAIKPTNQVVAQQAPQGGGGNGISDLLEGLGKLAGGIKNSLAPKSDINTQPTMNTGLLGNYIQNQMGTSGRSNTGDSRLQQLVQAGTVVSPELAVSPAFQTAKAAYSNAQQTGISKSPYYTVVDFSKPATSPRLYVVNGKTNQIMMNSYVTQGSGPDGQGGFSNDPNSHQSSLGTYLTGATYNGQHGPSMRVQGLDKGINDNAAARDIVVHPADYAKSGGRSWGCFGVPPEDAAKFAQLTQGGSIIHAYAPNSQASSPQANNYLTNPHNASQVLSNPNNNPMNIPQASQNIGSNQLNNSNSQTGTNQNMNPLTLNTIKQHEGYQSNPTWDVNAYRAGYGSDTVTLADGKILTVKPGMSVSREDAERDLNRRATDFENTAKHQVGQNVWQGLNQGAQAALTSVAYNYGSLPKRILSEVQSGDPQRISNAINSLGGDNKGINRHRRNQEAAMVLQYQ
jgi:GH24 family phage-related lysozyme (muramidase)